MTTTTVIDFIQSSLAPFEFQPTLDGQVYAARVKWNLFGKRYYLELTGLDGVIIVNEALIGSPVGFRIEELAWDFGRVTVTTTVPHKYRPGDTLELTISGCAPDAYNGVLEVLITGADTFTYPLSSNPGNASALGRIDYNINLVGGFFVDSALVFREPSQQFEIINP